MKAIKKAVQIDFFTWEEVVKMGLEANPDSIHEEGENARAWNFMFHNVPLTLENDNCYIVPTLEGNHNFTPEDVLIIGIKGEVYPCKKDIFEATYNLNGSLSFGQATEAMKQGKRVARNGWNGKGLFIFMQVPAEISEDIIPKMQSLPQSVKDEFAKRGGSISYSNQMALVNPDNSINGWAPSSSDTLAIDWMILD